MNIFSIVLHQVLVLAIVLFAALFCKKLGLFDDRFKATCGAYITNLALPCVGMSNILSPSVELSTYQDAGWCLLAAVLSIVCIFFITLGISLLVCKNRKIIPLNCIGWSTFNLFAFSIPIVSAIYGETGVFYSMLIYVACDSCMWTFEVYTVKKLTGEGGAISLRSIISPALCALVLALALKLAGIQLPTVLYEGISAIGGTMKVMCLVLLGVIVGGMPVKELFCDLRVYLFSFIKLLVIPFCLGLFFLGVTRFGLSQEALMTLLITFSVCPISVLPTVVANYGGDEVYTTKLVTFSTLFCIVTVPIMAGAFDWMQRIFG